MANVSASAGALLLHVHSGRARSRAELVALTGAFGHTLSGRVDQLVAADLLAEHRRWCSTVTHRVDDLVGAPASGRQPTPSSADGPAVQRVLDAVQRSAADRSTWTPVPL